MAKKVVDPVCKMEVDPGKAPARAEYKGKTYYFCAPKCKEAFVKNPERYLGAKDEPRPWWKKVLGIFRIRGCH
ncbi:MAG: YHS domain-containing protein [Candidatus Bipolaricaulaceae bacterium]